MFLDIINQIPPLTKIQLLLSLTLTVLVYTQILTKYDLYYNFDRIFYQFQFWRLITSVYYSGQMNIVLFIRLVIFSQISIKLEKSGFKRGSVDYLYFLIIIAIPLYVFATVFKLYSLNEIFYLIMYYIYGRKNRNDFILINLMPIRAPYFIWYMFFLNWVIRKSDIKQYIISILISHTIYFFSNIYPKLAFSNKRNYLDPPSFFIQFFSSYFQRVNNVPQLGEDEQQQNFG